jgi:RNA polymerase sigma factor (sigma-70 family)
MTRMVSTRARERRRGGDVAQLAQAAATGDERSWDVLVREFGGMIRAIAHAHRLSDADAAEVAQTTWLRLLEHVNELRDPAGIGAWLATTARRECLRVLRSSRRELLLAEDPPERVSRDAQPGDALLVAERNQALWQSFGSLRASDQVLLRILIADPRPGYEEIADTLQMPIGSIGPTRARALSRLRGELNRDQALPLMAA